MGTLSMLSVQTARNLLFRPAVAVVVVPHVFRQTNHRTFARMQQKVDVSAAELEEVVTKLTEIKQRIGNAAAKSPAKQQHVELVAVSKTKPAQMVQACYDAGHRHFGENYVQEFVEKAPLLPADINWHFIGHLQSNKCKALVSVRGLWVVESVDSIKLATTLNNAKEQANNQNPEQKKLRVMVQVNTSGEDSKSGVAPNECAALALHIVNQCPHLTFIGLMTIGKLGECGLNDFVTLSLVRDKLCAQLGVSRDDVGLSMGMSNDFELAIENGSSNVRVGSSIFGHRSYVTTTDTN
eukprot:c10625_g1_i3.p1 GENE.c10625_g1_i3~~c10625_g1_i3.p1  ORF type:complete len:295 (+),score=91.28 c10625_g1_i3:2-886(+)